MPEVICARVCVICLFCFICLICISTSFVTINKVFFQRSRYLADAQRYKRDVEATKTINGKQIYSVR